MNQPRASAPSGMSEAEWQARIELAACYRLFDRLGWHELIYNHITVRVPGTLDQFLINPFGLMYREIRASNLVKIDLQGNKLDATPHEVNKAGFVVHSSVHASRHDVHCVMHTHTTAGQAVSCQEEGLLPLSFNATFFTDNIAYHDFEGITLDTDECARMAADLGDRNVMILRNHGLLTCGRTVAEAFANMFMLERACEVQIAAMSGGARLRMPPHDLARKVGAQYARTRADGAKNDTLFKAMMRWMDEIDPGYRT